MPKFRFESMNSPRPRRLGSTWQTLKLPINRRFRRHGNPALPETQVGPITTQGQREKVLSYLGIARGEGAQCVLGGGKPSSGELAEG
jgi:acyl-CoA reductase-like NAD-dependent aldehyde dehydrogenase